MDYDEFCRRFFAEMTKPFPGRSEADRLYVEGYARETAPTYFADPDQREAGPEECARSDMSYWED